MYKDTTKECKCKIFGKYINMLVRKMFFSVKI